MREMIIGQWLHESQLSPTCISSNWSKVRIKPRKPRGAILAVHLCRNGRKRVQESGALRPDFSSVRTSNTSPTADTDAGEAVGGGGRGTELQAFFESRKCHSPARRGLEEPGNALPGFDSSLKRPAQAPFTWQIK